jgi:hypothetical protein
MAASPADDVLYITAFISDGNERIIMQAFRPLNTFMRNGKDPDPYLWLMDTDPDPGVQKHADPACPDPDPQHWNFRVIFLP